PGHSCRSPACVVERIAKQTREADSRAAESARGFRFRDHPPADRGHRVAPGPTAVKKIFNLLLGVVTSIGGFVEAGSISTAAQAGATFGFALLLGGACGVRLVA